ncbi:MAG: hypothetical protein COB20_12830 [SAR86 cluster bacterium]|uniref:Uncharacterized protein n=1 Tax=SAR86 cluster bacterium TaxID=2030880 RepID=A0A2A4WZ13_9GAMM|nr:MAG: hypothetical protein COB20_12830 [SAR86 cluster bacterium]
MNDNSDFNQLDALLAQPAVIADRGFSERVKQRMSKSNTARRNVFLITGFCWLALVLIAASPQAIYADFSTLALSLDISSLYPSVLNQFQSLSSSAQQLPYPTLAAALLSLAAVASMVVRA